jgi:hypothetical protein
MRVAIMRKKIYVIIIISAIFALFNSCNENAIIGDIDIKFPEENVSFMNHVQPFLKVTCSYQGCHSYETRAGGRILVDYWNLFDVYNPGMVVPYKPDNSILYQMIRDTNQLPHLPFVYWRITDNQKQGIKTWILEGAMDN